MTPARGILVAVLAGLAVLAAPAAVAAQSARDRYTQALAREREIRAPAGQAHATLASLRALVRTYEAIALRFPTSGYSDNALWQAAGLALEAFERFGDEEDRRKGLHLLRWLAREYPASSLVRRVPERVRQLESASSGSPGSAPSRAATRVERPAGPSGAPSPAEPPAARAAAPGAPVVLRDISRVRLPEAVRVTIELDQEVPYHQERLQDPDRIFFDFKGTQPVERLKDAQFVFDDDIVREIRLGRHPDNTTRVVLDSRQVARYSTFTLYNPYRLVIDCERPSVPPSAPPTVIPPEAPIVVDRPPEDSPAGGGTLTARPAAPTLAAPSAPPANSTGKFSLARQLGLGISRVVIDPGHGGHDPGARSYGLSEAVIALDIAQRLEKLFAQTPGFEVVLTRRGDAFVPLEERTAIANRENADLFLSIHVNASRNRAAHGIETYFLNFATNPEAEAVAARENSASGQAMRNLPDIVKAIALNNKVDESRDFAAMVQQAMARRLRPVNAALRNLGVKQAPFVVLIGAGMPSVLAEVAFLTNRNEARLLGTASYRQRIAEALLEAVQRYQRSLKNVSTVAPQE